MTFPVFSCLTVEPAHVSEAYFHPCKPLCGPSLQDHPALPIPALWLWSHLLNQVSHLSQAMGKLKYTLFYMGFVLKKKKNIDENSNVWKIQPVNVGTGVWFSLSKCWPRFTADPEAATIPACRAAECQHYLLPGEWPGHKGNICIKTKLTKQGSVSLPLQALVQTTLDSAYGPGSGLALPIPSRLPFTFSQVHWKATIRETHASGYGTAWVEHACLGETQLLTQESVNRCGWRCQL